jgi:hypothetical protein
MRSRTSAAITVVVIGLFFIRVLHDFPCSDLLPAVAE